MDVQVGKLPAPPEVNEDLPTPVAPQPAKIEDPGSWARILPYAARLKKTSRRNFLVTAGVSAALAGDMLFTRHVQAERRATKILRVPDSYSDLYFPKASWILFPGYKTSWEEAQWILNSLRPALHQRGRLAAIGYSNLGLDVDEIVRELILHVRELGLEKLYFYGHSFGGMLATQVAARLLELHGVETQLIVLDSSPFSRADVLDQSWFDGVVFLYENGFRIPSVLRGGYELGERVAHKDERTWRQILDQTMEQLSPIAPSSVLIQTESAYIYHFDGLRFAGKIGGARMAFLGNSDDGTVNYESARAGWSKVFGANMALPTLSTEGARPAHASPQWNGGLYRPLLEKVQNELEPLPPEPEIPSYKEPNGKVIRPA
ncbi:thioesterase domain-containing protein [Paenarthrobacter nitroguajacolicus]|uniref:thioesterase domain-containing protein n=1 Tax=Paenarthrobacter nitroguajacolicus TaxID=211146 RepID=UPI00285F947D|nr:thioesterase domain-containing protein [Paenarthrobacter nitroguajacolicus]MDR6640699.1 pimeloyl-ACP methyl ester carboxylesterase [Paenarthrobacter nitroguajacolicus]